MVCLIYCSCSRLMSLLPTHTQTPTSSSSYESLVLLCSTGLPYAQFLFTSYVTVTHTHKLFNYFSCSSSSFVFFTWYAPVIHSHTDSLPLPHLFVLRVVLVYVSFYSSLFLFSHLLSLSYSHTDTISSSSFFCSS